MPHTVLVVPVPELEAFVRERTAHYDASFLSADPTFVHAHITVLGPFLDAPTRDDLDSVAAVVSQTPAFEFEMDRIEMFPDGIIYLPPDPDGPFRDLTRRLVAAFPDCPPYAGAVPDPVPHLTLDRRSGTVTREGVRAALGAVLPATCRADRVALHRYANHDCRVLADWKLPAA